jgi:magnesium transporter
MDTPRSDRSQTRYSTPEPDLDDHRLQPESLPPVTESNPQARRGTLASLVEGERPPIPRLNLPTEIHGTGTIARDFENAIEDDDRSVKSKKSMRSINVRSPDEEWHRERRAGIERRGSTSPVAARRTLFRRPLLTRGDNESIRSESSNNSTSPPNSVDAFAQIAPPKRGRSGTVNSKAPSLQGSLHRTISGTASRRRPTFGEEDGAGRMRSDIASRRSSVEEDVCFPPEDPPNTYTIDFEDLEEFVSQTHTKTPVAHPFMPTFSKSTVPKRVFNDQRSGQGDDYFVDAEREVPDSTDSDEKEKNGELDANELHRPTSINEMPLNRWTFFSSEIDETIHAPELGGLLMPGETFRDLFELGPDGGVWWLDMLNPSEEEIFAICSAFRVHPLTREDITTQETREKVELFKTYYFLCFRSFYALDKQSDDYLEPINIYAVVFREGLLTFSFCQNNHAATVRKRIGRLRDYVNLSSDWVCYALIDEIVDSFAPVLRELEQQTDTIEDSVFTARFEDSRAMLKQIGDCRRRIMALTRLLGGKADVIKSFAKKCNESYAVAPRGDVGLYLSDVQDHIVTMMSNLNHFEKMLSRSHTNHLTQITLQHTEQGSRANELLGKITVIATILVPMNLVAGLFGMNVHVPGQDVPGYGWWFGIVGVVFGLALTCVTLAKKMKYI